MYVLQPGFMDGLRLGYIGFYRFVSDCHGSKELRVVRIRATTKIFSVFIKLSTSAQESKPSMPSNRLPSGGSHNVRLFTTVVACLGFCAIPLYIERNVKPGHEIFSSEKPQAVYQHEDRVARDKAEKQQ